MSLIYKASMEKFERKLREAFPRFKKFSLTQAKKETGTKHIQLNKWLPELVRQRKLRTVDWTSYFFAHPPDKKTKESLTALRKVNGSAVSEVEELKQKTTKEIAKNMKEIEELKRDIHNWKMTVQDYEKIFIYTRSKDRIVAF